jgi:hypothetical protein
MFQIEIPKRATTCIKGGESLVQGMEYYSTLIRAEGEEEYQRHDYCLACWEKTVDQAMQSSSWKSVVPTKKDGSELPKRRDERALYLLKEVLRDKENESSEAEAFVLSLYLARRRLIFFRQEMKKRDNKPVNIYEVAATEEMLCVPKFEISELPIEKIQLELAKKFKV